MAKRIPLVAIVGRPNVGKSTLFNRIVGGRYAIVEDTPGVTRDRLYVRCDYGGAIMEFIDTGGIETDISSGLIGRIKAQAELAIQQADVIIWLANARDDVTTADLEIAGVLRTADKPVILACNKCDVESIDVQANAYYSLGVASLHAISAAHGRGVSDLLDEVVDTLKSAGAFAELGEGEHLTEEELADLRTQRGGHVDMVRLCIIGRPNVGKSTLANALLGQERMLASSMPGTTRDAIDAQFEYEGETFCLVDTAGMRRPSRVTETIEQYSVSRAVRALERSHVGVLVLDATQTLADQDARIANLVARRGRACVVVVNKWDAVEKDGKTMKAYEQDLEDVLPFLSHAPRVFVSALTGARVAKLMPVVKKAYAAFNTTVSTSRLNRWLEGVVAEKQPPMHRGKVTKLYFCAQTQTRPPRFEIQCNIEKTPPGHYTRYLLGRLRKAFDLYGTPIHLGFRRKSARRAEGA